MNKYKFITLSTASLIVVILLIPTLLVLPFTGKKEANLVESPRVIDVNQANQQTPESDLSIAVYRSEKNKIEHLPIEEYIVGVVASEMPAEFELEALKAQALSARTYIVKQMLNDSDLNIPEGAMVTDTVMHQVYKSPEELKEIWGPEYGWKINRIKQAVAETRGQIITYNNEPITASFFSTSNGYTENSEDYWQNKFPYLRSVESPWDVNSPKFHSEKVVSVSQLEHLLGVNIDNKVGEIISKTEGNRVDKVKMGGETFEGREIREALDLKSSDFTFQREGNKVVFETRGYGHGVGMSQYGANGMAAQGKTVQEIITHYYKGTTISSIDPFESKIVVKK